MHHEQQTSRKAKNGVRIVREEEPEEDRPAHQENECYSQQEGQRVAQTALDENLMRGAPKESTFRCLKS